MFPATPLIVRQAPDHKTLRKTTILKVDDQPLSTPPIAQEYFEPGVNTKLNRRRKPKTDYTLPSDMPQLPMGVVPTNQTPGANGEEPPQIVVKETQPADLIEVFARIAAEEKALSALPKYGVDTGTMLMREYTTALKEARVEKKVESMLNEGFTPAEVESAMGAVRMEEAVKKAKEPTKAVSVQTALAETFGVGVGTERTTGEMEVQTEISAAGGKEVYARQPRRSDEEIAIAKVQEEIKKGTQATIGKFLGKK
jgi:hypothetical protein